MTDNRIPPAGCDPTSSSPRESPPQESLRREILAILVLYAAMSALPLLIGMAFAP